MTQGSISFDRIADRYDETRGGERRGQHVAAQIDPFLGEAHRVLEVGVGTGVVAASLQQLGRTVVGVDISAEMLSRAHARLGSRVARADAHQLPIPTSAIDAAYLVWVLHLVAEPAEVLAECARVLRPSGRVAVITGRPRTEAEDMTEQQAALDALRKTRRDTTDAVTEWGTAAGFEVVTRQEIEAEHWASPAEYADVIEQRTFSFVWDLDEATWASAVQPAIDSLRALPDPTRPRRVVHHRALLVFQKGGGA
ncbi:MAG TPA: methyltransferase domain-containing protein [Acidimicrobiales bacterium]|nr:methyltransferase domain-containing protein [Acidimicrobiales bacterium]